jgi:hypothetical protein
VLGIVRVANGAARGGVAPAGSAQVLALGLSRDLASGVEDAGDDRGVHVGHVALEDRRPDHHRNPGHADVVLERDAPSGEQTRPRAADRGLHVPGAEHVLLGARKAARRAGVGDFGPELGNRVELPVVVEGAVDERNQAIDLSIGEVDAERVGRFAHLPRGRFGKRQRSVSRS